MQNESVLWANQTAPPNADTFLHRGWEIELSFACASFIKTNKRNLDSSDEELIAACRWLIESLYQAYSSLPELPLAIPKSPNAFTAALLFAPPFGYRLTSDVVKAAIEGGYVKEDLGYYRPDGKGRVSRYTATSALRRHFIELGHRWQRITPPPPEKSIIIALKPKGEDRKIAELTDHKNVKKMRSNLRRINTFLAKQCVLIDLPDHILLSGIAVDQSKLDDLASYAPPELRSFAINFQKVFLRRVFSLSFDQGGRFYGGWWQLIKSDLRARVLINGEPTVECDFSSMALRMLYANEKVDPGMGDLYDLGLNYKNDSVQSRKLVKGFVLAVLNDKKKTFRLSKYDLKFLGVTHKELFTALCKRHDPIKHHFYSGIGLRLQYIDSQIAELVMLDLINENEVCLPVHDSFLVRRGLQDKLTETMNKAFRKLLGTPTIVDADAGYDDVISFGRVNKLNPQDDSMKLVSKHLDDYSILISLLRCWEEATFSKQEILDRLNKAETHQRD